MKKWILSTAALTAFCSLLCAQTETVDIVNFQFVPADLTITEGTTVTWINDSDMTHTSTSGTDCTNDGEWNSGNLTNGEPFSMTFPVGSAGEYPYFCMPHCAAGMTGSITVDVASSTSDITNPDAVDVYPNPFTERLTVTTEERFPGDFTISVYDIAGHLVMSKEREHLRHTDDHVTLHTSNLSKGMYVVRLTNESLNLDVARKVTKVQ